MEAAHHRSFTFEGRLTQLPKQVGNNTISREKILDPKLSQAKIRALTNCSH